MNMNAKGETRPEGVLVPSGRFPIDKEIDRLREINTELVSALQNLIDRYPNNVGIVQARAAIAKAFENELRTAFAKAALGDR